MNRSLVVITAGLSQPSTTRLLADRISGAVAAELTARGETIDIQVIELRELAVDLATMMATAGMPTARLDRARELVSDAAGLIVVTPVFAASYSGVFKMFFDALDTDALNGMPVIIAATAGTARHSMVLDHALRPLLTHLRATVMSTGIFAATDDFGSGEQGHHLTERIGRAANELAGQVATAGTGHGLDSTDVLAAPARPARTSGVTIDANVTPFARLLQGHTGS